MENEKNVDSLSLESVRVMSVNDINSFPSLACVCGLSFPDTANEFQKAALTLAHMMAALRESVLKGAEIPVGVVHVVGELADVMFAHVGEQLPK